VEAFTLLWNYEKATKGGFKIRAYKDALDKMALVPKVTVLADLEPLKGKTKDGGGLYQKAKEILETGDCESLKKITGEGAKWAAYDLFLGIHGIGPAFAHDLADDGYRTIVDLRSAVEKGTLKLNKTQTIGLEYYESIGERIPRSEMELHEATLKAAVAVPSDIVGSFRRQSANSGDIDLLLCSADPKQLDKVVEDLKKSNYIIVHLAKGKHKFMGICKLGDAPSRRLDILLTPPEEYGYALLYFTGSQQFNIRVRQHALTKGYSLNEHTLSVDPKWKGAKPAPIPLLLTEEAILAFLKIAYVKPSDRSLDKPLILLP
jgi:DNA polymerase/3'-5' exonuclease PolX